MPPLVPPTAVVTRRDAPLTEAKLAPLYFNRRVVEIIAPQVAPDPPRAGDTPARPSLRQVFLPLALMQWQAVSQQENFVRMWAPPPSADMPRGRMAPFRQRSNIRREPPPAYGSQFTAVGTPGGRLAMDAGMP